MVNHNWLADRHLVMQLPKLIILGKKDSSHFVSAAFYEMNGMAQKWLSDTLEKKNPWLDPNKPQGHKHMIHVSWMSNL